jgi:AcrR family transcriptional regulator
MSVNTATPLRETPRRAIRRTRRGDEKSEQIRSIATELFLRHGYEGVSVDEIVRVVGGSKTNVYNHFGNKEGLFVAIVKGLCDDLLASFVTIDVSKLSVEDGLRSLGSALLGILLQEKHLAFQRLIIAESGRFPAPGRLRRSDPHQSATLFHDMISFDLLQRAMVGDRPNDDEVRQRIEAAIEVFLHGFDRTGAPIASPSDAPRSGRRNYGSGVAQTRC